MKICSIKLYHVRNLSHCPAEEKQKIYLDIALLKLLITKRIAIQIMEDIFFQHSSIHRHSAV